MSATTVTRYRQKIAASGGHHCQVVLSREAHNQLQMLVGYHRLDRREIIERLIMGRPLAGGFQMTEQQQLRMGDVEYKEFCEARDRSSTSGLAED